MAETPVTAVLPHRRAETEYLASLNDRFANYVSKVHAVQEQTKSIENATLVAHAQSLSDEINSLKDMYEGEINKLRTQLDSTLSDKNSQELSSNKHIVLSAELEGKLLDEVACRKKVEAALGETHRLLSEKDAVIAELHISVSEHKQCNADLTREKDALTSFNSNLQQMHDNEATKRTEIETKYATLHATRSDILRQGDAC
jgi:chromosome segregation ATPase